MARDPRKNSSFESGMRGRDKPKVSSAHGGTMGTESDSGAGGESKQGPNKVVGNPDGVSLNDSAYSSGMRGLEKGKQKPASGAANKFAEEGSTMGGESKQGDNTIVGNPKGEQSWSSADRGPKKGVGDEHLRGAAEGAYKMGIPGNNTEEAAGHKAPEGEAGILGEEDDTHINIRIPKASLKRKNPGLQTS